MTCAERDKVGKGDGEEYSGSGRTKTDASPFVLSASSLIKID